MTERERLIELLGTTLWGNLCDHCGADKGSEKEKVLESTADYLLANGVILPPCKVGQEVYFINTFFSLVDDPLKEKVCGMKTYSDNMKFTFVTASQRCFDEDKLGKTVFLTREEAERALKGGAE